jgi:hypothetical protein
LYAGEAAAPVTDCALAVLSPTERSSAVANAPAIRDLVIALS